MMTASVTDDLLIIATQKFQEDQGLCLGNDNKNDKIVYKKQKQTIAVQMMAEPLLLASQNLKKTKGGIWGMTTRMMKSMKLCLTSFYICMLLS